MNTGFSDPELLNPSDSQPESDPTSPDIFCRIEVYSSLMRIRCKSAVTWDVVCRHWEVAGPPGSSVAGRPLYGLSAIGATQSWEALNKSLASLEVVWLRIR